MDYDKIRELRDSHQIHKRIKDLKDLSQEYKAKMIDLIWDEFSALCMELMEIDSRNLKADLPLPLDAEELLEFWCFLKNEKAKKAEENSPKITDFFEPDRDYNLRGWLEKKTLDLQEEIAQNPSQKNLEANLDHMEWLTSSLAKENKRLMDRKRKCPLSSPEKLPERSPKRIKKEEPPDHFLPINDFFLVEDFKSEEEEIPSLTLNPHDVDFEGLYALEPERH